VMVSMFVSHECPTCGPVVETFVSAEVTCRCGRRCRLPASVKAQLDRARKREARARMLDRSTGQSVADSEKRLIQPARSRGPHRGSLAIRVLVAFRLVSGLFVGRCEEWRMSPCVLVVGPGGGLVRPRARR
jgi:hypothetical protein